MLYQPAISPGGTSGRIGGQLEINNPESSPYADVSSVGTNPADRQNLIRE